MKALIATIVLCVPFIAHAVEYSAGWTGPRLYAEVAGCEAAIVLPAIQSFEKKGVAAGKSEHEVRNVTFSMVPLFEHAASATCYCAATGSSLAFCPCT